MGTPLTLDNVDFTLDMEEIPSCQPEAGYVSLGSVVNRCVAFHEPSNRWVSDISVRDISGFSTGSNSMLSFVEDRVLVHNHIESANCVFDGIQYGCSTDVYASEAKHMDKMYNAIAIHANHKPRIEYVEVENEMVRGGKMISKIFYKLIKMIDGVFKSFFMRNGYYGGEVKPSKLYNGDILRGKVLKSSLSYDPVLDYTAINDGIKLFKVDYECETSDY